MGGNFEASLVLLDDLWADSFRRFVSGVYAVAIPARDVLAFCDADSAAGKDELRDLIGRVYPNGDHPLANKLFFRTADGWISSGTSRG